MNGESSAHSERRLAVTVIDEELPFPTTSGKRIRTLRLLEQLSDKHDITFLSHRNSDPAEAKRAREYLQERGIECQLVDRLTPPKSTLSKGPAFYARLARNLLSPRPYIVDVNYSNALKRAIVDRAASVPVDVWHFEWTPYASFADDGLARRSVVVAHNVESQIWQRYWETEKNPLARWYIHGQWKKLERFESETFQRMARVVAVSDADAALMRSQFHRSDVDVVENGVDVDFFTPTGADRRGEQILFLGSLDWRPNLDAAKLLLDAVLPRVVAKRPSARLAIVGRTPPKWLVERVADTANATLYADVPDVRPYLAESTAMIVPLRIGGGTRLKILEAAAAGLPVVSTTVGAEGLTLQDGEHYFRADTPDDMADALCRCLADSDATSAMTASAREAVVEQYAWRNLAAKLERSWHACADASAQRRSLATVGGAS